MLDVAAVVARSKCCWTTTNTTRTTRTTQPAAPDRTAAERLLLWRSFPSPHRPSRSNRRACSSSSSSNIKRSSVGAVVVDDKEAAPGSTVIPKAPMDDDRSAEMLTTLPITLTTGGGEAPSSSAETAAESSCHDDSYQGRHSPTRPREVTSSSASRDRSQSHSSSATTFWESAEGGNSHELNVDDELELVDEARRRVASLFPRTTSLSTMTAPGIVSSASGSQDGDNDEEEDLIAAAAAVTMGVQQQAAAYQVQDVAVVPQFDFTELSLGKFLGRGGFSNVHEIRRICLKSGNEDDTTNDSAAAARQFLAMHCTRPSGEARYAIKQVRVDAIDDSSKASNNDNADACPQQQQMIINERRRRSLVGMMDLATEAEFLRRLEHPHVVKLRGTANCDALSPQYFLIVDRLCETLHSRLQSWKEQRRQLRRSSGLSMSSVNRLMSSLVRRCSMGSDASGGGGSSRHGGNGDSTRAAAVVDPHQRLWRTRLSAACDLVSAIEYLHENRIVHRDIKPTNIGFDIRGDLKIFDFGMARILDPRDADADGTYPNLSHMTGSLRYMAPEVALGLPYHTSCDVYSLSLVIWEMLSLQRPYQAITSSKRRGRRSSNAAVEDETSHFRHKVFEGKVRPVVPSKWPTEVQQAVTGGWAHDVKDRLNVHQLSSKLVSELVLPKTTTRSVQQLDDDTDDVVKSKDTIDDPLDPCSVRINLHNPSQGIVLPDRRRRRSTHVFRPPCTTTSATSGSITSASSSTTTPTTAPKPPSPSVGEVE